MASSLSEDEFQRIQNQLIQLRSDNYTLDETCQKQQLEVANLVEKYDLLEKEYQKAQKALAKSKKAKDVELLLQENETMQRKLLRQEEDFQMQNTTMMQELSMLVSQNEKLENEVKELKSNVKQKTAIDDSIEISKLEDDLRILRAENATLQKNLLTVKNNSEEEISRLRESLNTLYVQFESQSLNHEKSDLDDSWSVQENSDDYSDVVEVGCGEVIYHKSPNGSIVDVLRQAEDRVATLEKELKEFEDLKHHLAVEREEKLILKQQLLSAQSSNANQSTNLQEEVDQLKEKLKKKQESLIQLQAEKEALYAEKTQAIEALQNSKDQDIQNLKEHNQRLQTQINNSTQNSIEFKEKMNETVKELELKLQMKEAEVNEQSAERLKELEENRHLLLEQLTETSADLNSVKEELNNAMGQLREVNNRNEELTSKLTLLVEEQTDLTQKFEDIRKVAEKRKTLMDEMANNLQRKVEEHQAELEKLVRDYTLKLNDLNEKLEEEKMKTSQLEEIKIQVEDYETQVQSLQCTKGWFERRLNEAEATIEKNKTHFESILLQKNDEHESIVLKMTQDYKNELKDLETQLEICSAQKTECEEAIQRLRQDVKDGIEDRKIHEKKGASIVKDLKRQLQMERKRSEKLQERLQEILNDSTQSRSAEVIAFKPPGDSADRGDTSSISSWSVMSGQLDKDTHDGSGNESVFANGNNSPTPANVLEQENYDLLCRVTSLQEEKWILEEKVNHLEESNSAMADDLVQKQAIIQFYCMDGRADRLPAHSTGDKLTVKRVVDFIKDKGDENQREINRKLLRTLEETLTKNMCLQKDLEMLSQEVVRLGEDSNGGFDMTSSVTTEMFTSVGENNS